MDWTWLAVEDTLRPENLAPLMDAVGESVDRVSTAELRRVATIDPRSSARTRGLIDTWRQANVNLIESGITDPLDGVRLRPSLMADVSRTIERAHAGGLRVEQLAGELTERFALSTRRAELIARDQVLKLNSQIHKMKQQDLGVTQYTWKTAGDRRVRKTHRRLDNTVQSWDDPPEVAPGRHEHPGGDYQCRCRAAPIIPD
jgi:SPP1 gp7 family putative phage head morphogenesis protein